MMAVNLSPLGGAAGQFFDNNGAILSGGKIYTYVTGTTTPQTTYTSVSGVTAHANPIILDSAGRVPGGEIWLTNQADYKFVIETASGVLLGTYNDIVGINGIFVNTLLDISTLRAVTWPFSRPSTVTLVNNWYAGDGGGSFRWDSTSTADDNNGTIIKEANTTTGRWLRQITDRINVTWFGAVGDGVTDDRAAIQNAINAAIYNGSDNQDLGLKRVVYLPAAIYYSSGEIHLGYGYAPGKLQSVTIEGDGPRYRVADAFNGTAIVFGHNNAPGLTVQGGRTTIIRMLSIKGANFNYVLNAYLGTSLGPQTDLLASTWVDPTFPAASSARYTPYAGIAIDPRSGPAPATPYPDVVYPPYLNSPSQYNKNASSETLIEDVQIFGFVVGVAQQPGNWDGNGEYTTLVRTTVQYCQYAFSISTTQSRLVKIKDSIIANVHTGIVTNKFGLQTGKPSFRVENTELSFIIQWCDVPNLPLGGTPTFVSCYGETMYKLGNAGVGASGNGPISFQNCAFNFQLQINRGAPKYIFEFNGSNGYAVFENCDFADSLTQHYAFFSDAGAASLYFYNVKVNNFCTELYRKFSTSSTCGISTNRLEVNFGEFNVFPIARYNLDTGTEILNNPITKSNTGPRNRCLPAVTQLVRASSAVEDAGFGARITAYAWGSGGRTFTVTGRQVVASDPGGISDWFLYQNGFCNGDTVWESISGITFVIKSRTGAALTMEAITGFDNNGNLLAVPTAAGVLYGLNSRVYSTNFPLYANTVNNNAVASVVSDGAGASAFIDTAISVNDYVRYTPYGENYLGDINRLQITARNGGAATITVNGEFKRTATFRRIPLLIREEPPNA